MLRAPAREQETRPNSRVGFSAARIDRNVTADGGPVQAAATALIGKDESDEDNLVLLYYSAMWGGRPRPPPLTLCCLRHSYLRAGKFTIKNNGAAGEGRPPYTIRPHFFSICPLE